MNIIFRFVEICFFKASPADIPSSHWLMKISLLVYLTMNVFITRIDNNWDVSLFSSLTDMLVMIIVAWLLLKFRNFSDRYQQTVTAMAGVGSVMSCIGIPIVYFFSQVNEQQQFAGVAMLLLVALLIWSLMVNAHIFRTALEIKPSSAVMLTVAYTILSLMLVGLTVSGVA